MIRATIIIFFIFFGTNLVSAQEEAWFYLRAKDTLFEPEFRTQNDTLFYTGNNKRLKEVLDEYIILDFKKTYRNARRENLKRTFFVRANDEELMEELLEKTGSLFTFGELISEDDKKIFEPNDYGLTSTIGDNLGAQVNLDYLDYLGLPKAWYYTTGSRDIIIGISDGGIDTISTEFKGKTKVFRKSPLSKGHGYSVAATAAAQGNNAYGIPGICYDCSIYGTTYDHFKTLEQLVELSRAGAKVINCSWGLISRYDTAQEAINEMFENGTIVVAIGHNKKFSDSKGQVYYYPAGYDNVISVSSAMHRYEKFSDNISKKESKRGMYYVDNIRGYISQRGGFKDNDTTRTPFLYENSMKNFNSDIDILGPSVGIFRYGELVLHGVEDVSEGSQTSGVAPLITGSIGLMFSLAPCLPANEVESILKMTSTNIDDIEPNKPYKGLYGAGILHTGRAVEMVYQMYAENETVTIENQDFMRWDFKLTTYSTRVVIKNQKFTDKATLDLRSKNQIVIGENTVLKPNESGSISLKIDPSLERKCELQLRDPSILDK